MRWRGHVPEAVFPSGFSVSRGRARTGAPKPIADPTTKRVLLWFAIIAGLMIGFWLETVVARLVLAA